LFLTSSTPLAPKTVERCLKVQLAVLSGFLQMFWMSPDIAASPSDDLCGIGRIGWSTRRCIARPRDCIIQKCPILSFLCVACVGFMARLACRHGQARRSAGHRRPRGGYRGDHPCCLGYRVLRNAACCTGRSSPADHQHGPAVCIPVASFPGIGGAVARSGDKPARLCHGCGPGTGAAVGKHGERYGHRERCLDGSFSS